MYSKTEFLFPRHTQMSKICEVMTRTCVTSTQNQSKAPVAH